MLPAETRSPEGAPTRLGPWRLSGLLGRGGAGIVSRAVHEQTGAVAALKTVAIADAASVWSIRREIVALSRLHHPGIVRIVDAGAEGAVPWYAMEVVEGPTLRDHCRARWDPEGRRTPAGLADVLTAFRRLCSPLAYLHGEGLVHRDLKPRNVLVRTDGTPVIVDFGLSAGVSGRALREELHPSSDSGTGAYMAPEQARGEPVDARADLFALGAMLHALLTGRPPFPSLDALVQGGPPPPASALVPEIPSGLDGLLASLLESDPRKRMGHADDVARALASLGAGDAPAGPPPRPCVYRPALAGREEILAALRAHVRVRLERREGDVILVGGPSGIGKTRVVLEIAKHLAGRAPVVACQAIRGSAPLGALRPVLLALLDRCRAVDRGGAAALLGRDGRLLVPYEPALAQAPGIDDLPEPPRLPPRDASVRLCEVLAGALAAMAPLCVMVDDLQDADGLTLAVMEHLVATPARGVVVLGTYRTGEVDGPLRSVVASARDVTLAPLDLPAVRSIVADMLALPSPPDTLIRAIAARADGNPFFVAEYVRAAIAQGYIHRADGAWRFGDDAAPELLPPEAVAELVTRRLELLGQDARRCAAAAAVLGRSPELPVLAAMDGVGLAEMLPAVAELVARQVLEEAGSGRYRFVHDQIREAALASLSAASMRSLNLSAARAIDGDPERRDRTLPALARHWELGGDVPAAAACYLEAARAMLAQHALPDAEPLFRKHLELAPLSVERVVARVELATKVYLERGDRDRMSKELPVALAEAESLGDRRGQALALLGLSRAAWVAGDLDRALPLAEQAIAVNDASDRALHGSLLGNMATVLDYQGRFERARDLYRQALAIHEEQADHLQCAVVLNGLGCSLRDSGMLDDAAEHLGRALVAARRVPGSTNPPMILQNLSLVRRDQGRIEESRTLLEQALAASREMGLLRHVGRVLENLGSLVADTGDRAAARAYYSEAIERLRACGDRHYEGVALGNFADMDLRDGRVAEARAGLARAAELLLAVGDRMYAANVLCNQARLEREQGDHAAAASFLERAGKLLAQVPDPILRIRWLCERGQLELAGGRPALAFLAEADAAAEAAGINERSSLGMTLQSLRRAIEAAATPRAEGPVGAAGP